MTYPRHPVDLSGYPDLVVVYLGYQAKGLKGARSLLRIGRGLRAIKRKRPDGLLSHEDLWFGVLHPGFRQYWRDFDSLEAFTRAPQHKAWWADFAQHPSNGGIWHETYRLRGGMEAIYSGMPNIGLSSFAPERSPVGPFMSARQAVGGHRSARQLHPHHVRRLHRHAAPGGGRGRPVPPLRLRLDRLGVRSAADPIVLRGRDHSR